MTSYSKDLWNKMDAVLVQSLERRREIDDFINAINKRIQVEETYARSIQAVGCLMDRYIGKKSAAAFTYSAFKSDHMHRAEQARVLVTSLKDEVLTLLREMQQTQNGDFKRVQKESRKLEKDLLEHREKLGNLKNKAQQAEKEKEEQQITIEILKATSEGSHDKKQKQQSKVRDSQKEFKEYQSQYKTARKQYNDFLSGYKGEMEKLLTLMEQHECDRLEKQVDTIMKILVFETAMMRNFDYDISNISSQMEGIQPKDDVKAFIKEHADGTAQLQPELQPNTSLLSTVLSKMASKEFESRLQFERNETIRGFIEQHWKEEKVAVITGLVEDQLKDFESLVEIVSSCWKNKPLSAQVVHGEFKELMDKDENRYFFQLASRFYGSHYSLELMERGYDDALRLFEVAIEKSLEKKDVFTIRKLIGLIFSQWTMDPPRLSEQEMEKLETMSMKEQVAPPKPKHKLLYSGLTHLSLWRDQDFWESSILQSIQEEFSGLQPQKGETASETRAKERNIVLSQLASYSHIMIMLGTTPKNVKQSIGRFCRLYNLGEDENKDLSKTITETWKVYKDLHNSKEAKVDVMVKKKEEPPLSASNIRAMMP